MKKTIGFVAGVLAANTAYAQSTGTLYGTLDDGFTFTSNQASSYNYQASTARSEAANGAFPLTRTSGANGTP